MKRPLLRESRKRRCHETFRENAVANVFFLRKGCPLRHSHENAVVARMWFRVPLVLGEWGFLRFLFLPWFSEILSFAEFIVLQHSHFRWTYGFARMECSRNHGFESYFHKIHDFAGFFRAFATRTLWFTSVMLSQAASSRLVTPPEPHAFLTSLYLVSSINNLRYIIYYIWKIFWSHILLAVHILFLYSVVFVFSIKCLLPDSFSVIVIGVSRLSICQS